MEPERAPIPAGQTVAALTHIFLTHNILSWPEDVVPESNLPRISQLKLIQADGRVGPRATVPALTQRQHRIDTDV
jgi:hypothetical protein